MYVVIYRYEVPRKMKKRYLELMKKTADLYAKNGCLGCEILEDAQQKGNWLETNRFRDKEHYQKVHAAVDEDPPTEILWQEFCSITGAEKNPPIKNEYELQMKH